MKTPIEPRAIRTGDLIRWESGHREGTAAEYRATQSRDQDGWTLQGKFYLLDRPKPVVDLPTEPTLGWLTYLDIDLHATEIAKWCRRGDGIFGPDGRLPVALATAFTPATAVPTEALDELREFSIIGGIAGAYDLINDFLTAVDEANRPTS